MGTNVWSVLLSGFANVHWGSPPRNPETFSLGRREGTAKIADRLLRTISAVAWLLGPEPMRAKTRLVAVGAGGLNIYSKAFSCLHLVSPSFKLKWGMVFILAQSVQWRSLGAYSGLAGLLLGCLSSQESGAACDNPLENRVRFFDHSNSQDLRPKGKLLWFLTWLGHLIPNNSIHRRLRDVGRREGGK